MRPAASRERRWLGAKEIEGTFIVSKLVAWMNIVDKHLKIIEQYASHHFFD